MAKFRNIKNSFTSGEVPATVLGRTDLPQYQHACKRLHNMIPMLAGGAYRRPGTLFENKYDSDAYQAPFIIPFKGSDETRYMINLVQGSITNAHAQAASYFIGTTKVTGTTENAGITLTARFPYLAEEFPDVRYAQSGDVMWLTHTKHKPLILKRLTATTFSLTEFDYELLDASARLGAAGVVPTMRDAWPYRPQNVSTVTVAPSAVTGAGVTLTASAPLFHAGHVGSVWKINHAGTIGAILITGFTSSTIVTGFVVNNFGATTAVVTWWESAWSDYRGWPGQVSFFSQRLVMAGSPANPDSMWFTRLNAFQTFSKDVISDPSSGTGTDITEPFIATLATPYVARITWLKTGEKLLVGTHKAEWFIDRILTSTGFGPGNAGATHSSDYGSNGVVEQVGNEVFFVGVDGLTVRSLVFSVYDNTYIAESIQYLYPEFPFSESNTPIDRRKRGIKQIMWDETRHTLWCLDWAGNLVGMSHDRKLSLTMWHSHSMAGYDPTRSPGGLDGGDLTQYLCTGSIMSMALLQNDITDQHDLWVVVRRYVNGHWWHFIERMTGGIVSSQTNRTNVLGYEAFWTDATVYIDATTGPTWTLAHFPATSISGNADSRQNGLFALTPMVSSGGGAVTAVGTGAVELPGWAGASVYNVALGLPFTSTLEPVTPNAGSVIGDAVGGIQRPTKAIIRFDRTMQPQVGQTDAKLRPVSLRDPATNSGDSDELFSGIKEISLDANFVRDGAIVIQQSLPYPMTVVSIVTEGLCYD